MIEQKMESEAETVTLHSTEVDRIEESSGAVGPGDARTEKCLLFKHYAQQLTVSMSTFLAFCQTQPERS
jgi:hypothetical protein